MTTLAERLRWLRKQAKLTLAQVSARALVSVSFLSEVERGHTLPSLPTLERIAAVYGLSLGEALVNVTTANEEADEGSDGDGNEQQAATVAWCNPAEVLP